MQYDVKINSAPVLEYEARDAQVAKYFECSQKDHIPMLQFFDSLGNMDRKIDLTHPGHTNFINEQTYVYRTGICVYSEDFVSFPTDIVDTCAETNNQFTTVDEKDGDLDLKLSV
jgi:hypothetical protein